LPRVIDLADVGCCGPGECIAALDASGFDPRDEASLLHAAGWLRRLGNNRDFLAEIMLAELAGRHRPSDEASAYGPQVIMLSPRRRVLPAREHLAFAGRAHVPRQRRRGVRLRIAA